MNPRTTNQALALTALECSAWLDARHPGAMDGTAVAPRKVMIGGGL